MILLNNFKNINLKYQENIKKLINDAKPVHDPQEALNVVRRMEGLCLQKAMYLVASFVKSGLRAYVAVVAVSPLICPNCSGGHHAFVIIDLYDRYLVIDPTASEPYINEIKDISKFENIYGRIIVIFNHQEAYIRRG